MADINNKMNELFKQVNKIKKLNDDLSGFRTYYESQCSEFVKVQQGEKLILDLDVLDKKLVKLR